MREALLVHLNHQETNFVSSSQQVRISHEISHSWFGLVIGALDWTEEWLSEVCIAVVVYYGTLGLEQKNENPILGLRRLC